MSKFFVTGGSGFIGSNLVKKLLSKGHYVKVFDDFSRGKKRKINFTEKKFQFVNGDIRDEKKVIKESKGFDFFIHLAAINGTKFFYEKPQDVLDVSIKGILAVMEACKKNKIKKIIFSSSSEVYQNPPMIPTKEGVPLIIPDVFNPRYSYGAGKIISEMVLLNYYRDFFKKIIIFRPHNVYGPDMGWEHVIPEMILRSEKIKINDKTFLIKGDGKQTRSFIFIEDFTDILYKVITKGKHRNIYHIGNNDEIKIMTLAKKIIKYQKKNVQIICSQEPYGETPRRCPNIEKIEGLGYKQKYSIDDGLRITINWYIKNKKFQENK